MRFKIINSNRSINNLDKTGQNEAQTRPNSSSKSNSKNSFLQMVKSSYQYYSTVGKDVLIEQQIKVFQQKQQKIKSQQKKLNLKQLRQYQKQQQANQQMQDIQRQIRKAKRQDQKNKKIKKASTASTRTSKRIKKNDDISPIFKKQDNQIFDVLNLEPRKIALQEEKTIQVHQQKIYLKQRLKENIQKLKKQLIFQEEGTYQINLAHQVMLKAQHTIDEHINFKHEIRQSKVMDMNQLIKYMKIHGFSTFNQKTFSLLTSINPYLYSYRETVQANKIVINTFKLNGIQISQRLESTRRRMSQVSVPELLT